MDLYFGNKTTDDRLILSGDEARHLKVVRKNIGDLIQVTDGEGNLYTASIAEINKNDFITKIESTTVSKLSLPLLHLAIAPTKNMDRIEWLVEKCIEAGIYRFSFLQCRHSERKEIKTERLRRIAVSALKQSQKTFMPQINEMISFNNFMKAELEEQRLICSMDAVPQNYIKHLLDKKKNAVILIGPEGDFHSEELKLAEEKGFQLTGLGPERLRTETAALAACFFFNFNKHE